jgi:hypothetical protein
MSNVTAFPSPEWVVELGPKRPGHSVIVDGRCIPKLTAIDNGEIVTFVLDERFLYDVPKGMSGLFASAMAQALAIGAGFPHLGAGTRDCCFAPAVLAIAAPSPDPD